MQQAMKRMGIKQDDIPAKKVIILLEDSQIIINHPNVVKVNMAGQESYQITGNETLLPLDTTPDINEEDLKTVMDATNCSREQAMTAILTTKGDLAQAILNLK
ncbi:MAG: nascent polypeptide-associated complex protein [archaeon]